MKFKLSLLKKAAVNWNANDPFGHSAAIAYYTIFSFPALILIYLTIASAFVSREETERQVSAYLSQIVGKSGVHNIQHIIERSTPDYTSSWALIFGSVILVYAGLKLFLQLQKSLNLVWRVKPPKHGTIMILVKARMVSLAVMLVVGFIILVSLLATVMLTAAGEWAAEQVSSDMLAVFHGLNFIFSLLTITVLFTILLKLLPAVRIPWRYAFFGGGFSALLFVIGEYGLSIYFSHANPTSAYGVAGSIILLMLWVSYTSLTFLFGAELTRVIFEHNETEKPVAKHKKRNVRV